MLFLTVAGPVLADPPAPSELRLPIAEAERPLTLPRFILGSAAVVDVNRIQANDTYANLTVGVSFGITDDLVVRALVLPIQLGGPVGQGFHYGQTSETRGPSVGATYRFVRGPVEIGAGVDVRVFTTTDVTGGAIIPTVPVLIHVGHQLRIDTGATLNITRATSTTTGSNLNVNPGGDDDSFTTTRVSSANAVRLNVPVSALYNLTEPLHVGVNTGLTIYDFSNVDNSTGIPLGIFAGYSIAGDNGPILDITPSFSFPYLIMPGRSEVTNAGQYVVGLSLGGFIYL